MNSQNASSRHTATKNQLFTEEQIASRLREVVAKRREAEDRTALAKSRTVDALGDMWCPANP